MENTFQQQQTKANLSAIIEFITDTIKPEKIFCLSHQTDSKSRTNLDLLIVIPEDNTQHFQEIEKVLSFYDLKQYRINYTLYTGSHFDTMIKEGHIYYALACNEKPMIYDNGYYRLPEINQKLLLEKREKAKNDFTIVISKAQTLYATATTLCSDNLNMAGFLLHQAAELSLRSLMKALTGYENSTHNLKTLTTIACAIVLNYHKSLTIVEKKINT